MDCKIIADSCCDMTSDLRKRLGVISIPLTIRLGQDEYIDDENLDLPDFMAKMKACTEKVGSASPAPLLYQEAIETTKNSFVVTLSSWLSGSYASAVMGKNFAEENEDIDTYVFDSKSASAGEVLVTIKIRELLQSGAAKDHIIQSISQFIENMKTYFVLDRYDNLLKSGRLNKIAGKLISILNIRLLMGSNGNGEIALFAKLRGRSQIVNKLVSFIEDSGKKTDGESLVISHCNNPSLAQKLSDAIEHQFHFKEVFIVSTSGISSLYADDKGIIIAF